ncbi:hypothetical protein JHK87_050282 [Glycine soja]|nr:hypothetical protein JHK87_050282 [Glycine soja]
MSQTGNVTEHQSEQCLYQELLILRVKHESLQRTQSSCRWTFKLHSTRWPKSCCNNG